MAREMLLAGAKPEELMPPPPPEKPKTIRGKLANFWYHYKVQFLLAVFLLAAVIVLFVMMFSDPHPDYQVVLVTTDTVGAEATAALSEAMKPYGTDVNGNGQVEVEVESLVIGDGIVSSPMTSADLSTMMSYFASGSRMIFVFEPFCYENRVLSQETDEFIFFDALDVNAEGYHPTEHYWDWQHDARSRSVSPYLPQSLYFGVRAVNGMATGAESRRMNEQGKALMEAFIQNECCERALPE